jgi:nucleoside-diphosphate-sugar epimerase
MKVLVTGGTGFVGGRLVRDLLREGVRVKVLARKTSELGELQDLGAELVFGDIAHEESLTGAAQDVDVVYHLAAQLGGWGIPEKTFRDVNVLGTRNMLESCLRAKGLFVYISTPGVMGFRGNLLADETCSYEPRGIYEETKALGEQLCLRYFHEKGLRVTIIRPDFVYGPGDRRRVRLFRNILNGKFFVIGNGTSFLRPTYVDDVVKGLELLLNAGGVEGEIFNIAGPEVVTVREFADTVASVLGVALPRLDIPRILAYPAGFLTEVVWRALGKTPPLTRSMVDFLTVGHASDISKAVRQLRFRPETGLRSGIEKTVCWYRESNLL